MRLNRSRLVLAAWMMAVCGLCGMRSAFAGVYEIAPQGEYAQIDTRISRDAVRMLEKGSSSEREAAIAAVKAHPENYAPPVFYALSGALFSAGEKDDAAFWFYAGQLRARIDATICADSSAGEAVWTLNNRYGPQINVYAFQDMNKLKQLVPKVVEWERGLAYRYDRRWINLYGMNGVASGLLAQSGADSARPLSYPEEQWAVLAEKTRVFYLDSFWKMVKQRGAAE